EPQEQGRGQQRETAATGHQVAEGTLDEAETVTAGLVRLREEALQQLVDVQLVYGKLVLDQVGDDRHDERDEWDGGEEDVEGDGAGEKGNIVFVGGLEGTPGDAGGRAVPAAFTIHASGSSSWSGGGGTVGRARARRRRAASSRRRNCSRVAISGSSSSSSSASSDSSDSSASSSASFKSPRTSSTFSSASSFRLRRPLPTLRRVLSPPSVGANTKPATAPRTMPKRNAPNPPPRSLIRRPPRHRARPRGPRGGRDASRASASRSDR